MVSAAYETNAGISAEGACAALSPRLSCCFPGSALPPTVQPQPLAAPRGRLGRQASRRGENPRLVQSLLMASASGSDWCDEFDVVAMFYVEKMLHIETTRHEPHGSADVLFGHGAFGLNSVEVVVAA